MKWNAIAAAHTCPGTIYWMSRPPVCWLSCWNCWSILSSLPISAWHPPPALSCLRCVPRPQSGDGVLYSMALMWGEPSREIGERGDVYKKMIASGQHNNYRNLYCHSMTNLLGVIPLPDRFARRHDLNFVTSILKLNLKLGDKILSRGH